MGDSNADMNSFGGEGDILDGYFALSNHCSVAVGRRLDR